MVQQAKDIGIPTQKAIVSDSTLLQRADFKLYTYSYFSSIETVTPSQLKSMQAASAVQQGIKVGFVNETQEAVPNVLDSDVAKRWIARPLVGDTLAYWIGPLR